MTVRPKSHVAFFLPSLAGGGAEHALVRLAAEFAKRGHKVDMVLGSVTGPYLSECGPSVRVVDLARARVRHALPALVRYLRLARPDAMVSGLDHASVLALIAKRLARVSTRIVVCEQGHLGVASRSPGALVSRPLLFFVRWCYPWADAIVAVSRGVAEDLVASFGVSADRVTVIANPVVIAEGVNPDPPADPDWFRPGDPPVVLAAGRLVQQKDFSTLLRAFARVHARIPCRMVILGEGPERAILEGIARELGLQDVVALPGFRQDLHRYMRHARLFVLSSIWEGFANVIAEALACGCPVVSTDCPSGPAEILDDGRFGRLARVGDAAQLSQAIFETMTSSADPTHFQRRAHDYSIGNVADEYERVLWR